VTYYYVLAVCSQSEPPDFVVLKPTVKGMEGRPPPPCCSGPHILSCTAANINKTALTSPDIRMPGGLTFKQAADSLQLPSGQNERSRSFLYKSPGGALTVTCSNSTNGCHAHSSTAEGGHFVLENCGPASGHVWKKMDYSGLKEADPIPSPPGKNDRLLSHNRFLKDGLSDNTTMANYSIKFYYTAEFAAVTPDIPGFIDQIITETNQGYANSRVPLRAYSLCHELATIRDNISGNAVLGEFTKMKAGPAEIRDTADVAHLLVKSLDACGVAYFNALVGGWTLSVTQKACAVGYYTSGHEIGA